MPPLHQPGSRLLAALVLALATGACAQSPPDAARAVAAATQSTPAAGCLAAGDGNLQARVRGALVADLDWGNAQMQCEGGMRPDGQGLRVAIAGPMPAGLGGTSGASAPALLRFIFGIDLQDVASGAAQALPTNLTVIVEGGQQLYATRGDDKCAVENLQRTPIITSNGKLDRVHVRGYCTGPAADLDGNARVLVPTFAFTAVVHNGDGP
ncbi:MAG: hypothetical protein ABIP38_01410 [Steroidobacteraceae bacterium]